MFSITSFNVLQVSCNKNTHSNTKKIILSFYNSNQLYLENLIFSYFVNLFIFYTDFTFFFSFKHLINDTNLFDTTDEIDRVKRITKSSNNTIINPTIILQSPVYVSLLKSLAELCCKSKQEESNKASNPVSVVSSRQVCNLALIAFSKYIDDFQCDLDDFIEALRMTIQDLIRERE